MKEKTRYTKKELEEFRQIITEKLASSRQEFKALKETIQKENGTMLHTTIRVPDDSARVAEREKLNQLASRLYKFIKYLELAMERIEKGTYGICVVTKKLISKERLCVVPHTTHSVVAKQRRNEPFTTT